MVKFARRDGGGGSGHDTTVKQRNQNSVKEYKGRRGVSGIYTLYCKCSCSRSSSRFRLANDDHELSVQKAGKLVPVVRKLCMAQMRAMVCFRSAAKASSVEPIEVASHGDDP